MIGYFSKDEGKLESEMGRIKSTDSLANSKSTDALTDSLSIQSSKSSDSMQTHRKSFIAPFVFLKASLATSSPLTQRERVSIIIYETIYKNILNTV